MSAVVPKQDKNDTVGEFVLRRKWEKVPQATSLFLLHRYFGNSKLHVLQRNSPTVSFQSR